jgi:hypothetical protein
MMSLLEVAVANLETLTNELAAAGWDSTQTEVRDAREAVARLLCEANGPYELCDENNDTIRDATVEEVIESVLAGAEGWIMVDGVKCYVQG